MRSTYAQSVLDVTKITTGNSMHHFSIILQYQCNALNIQQKTGGMGTSNHILLACVSDTCVKHSIFQNL